MRTSVGAVAGASDQRNEDRVALRRQALMIKRGSARALSEEQDRKGVEQHYQSVL